MSTYPQAWPEYQRLLRSTPKRAPDDRSQTLLARFAARYRMSRSVDGVVATALSERTRAGYSSGIRLGLAYSTLEALEKALDGNSRAHRPILRPDLASRLRDTAAPFQRFRLLLTNEVEAKKLQERLAALFNDGTTSDIRPAVQATRNLVFHGAFTPHGSGLTDSPRVRRLVDDLTAAVLDVTDQRFTTWVTDRTD